MCAPKSSPYWKSNSSCPLFSTGMAKLKPSFLAVRAMSAPNCSSTRMPPYSFGAPSSTARRKPSKMTVFASAIRSVSSGLGSPARPKNFFTNEPRWSNARMYSDLSYPSAMGVPPRKWPDGDIVPVLAPSRLLEGVLGLEELHVHGRGLALERLRVGRGAHHEAVVHGDGDLGRDDLGQLGRLGRRHGVRPADRQERDVRLHAVELGRVVRVSGVEVGGIAQREDVAHPVLRSGVVLQSLVHDVVGGNGLPSDPLDLERVAGADGGHIARQLQGDVLRGYDLRAPPADLLEVLRVVVVEVCVRDEDDVGRWVARHAPRVDVDVQPVALPQVRGLPIPREPLQHRATPFVRVPPCSLAHRHGTARLG